MEMQELKNKAENLGKVEKELVLLLLKIEKSDYSEKPKYRDKVKEILCKDVNIAVKTIRELVGEYFGDVIEYLIKHKTEYSYSIGYYRRPFRTNNIEVHLDSITNKLVETVESSNLEFSIMEYLTVPDYKVDYSTPISEIIAFEIDRDNQEVINALKQIIYGDNNTALLSYKMIKGIFLSHNQELYNAIGELLKAAKLQEGLRQSIVENMDQGTLEACLCILKIIIDNNFIRFSSVIRALGTWTGMDLGANNQRVAKQCIEYAYTALNDTETCEEWINSEDVNKLYMSLWATAVREEENLYPKIYHIMENGETYQKIVLQYFLAQSQNSDLRFNISRKYLEQSEMELQYWIIHNYDKRVSYSWEVDEETGEYTKYLDRVEVLEDKEERVLQFNILKNMLLKMPKKEITFKSKIYEWLDITYSTDLIAKKMLYITTYYEENEFINQLIGLKDLVSPEIRGELLKYFIRDKEDKTQREFIFEMLSDKSMANREKALEKIIGMELDFNEIEKMGNILKLKTGSLRQNAVRILLSLNNEKLEQAVEALIKSKDELQRLAALDIINKVKEDKKNEEIYNILKSKIELIQKPTEKEKILILKLDEKAEYSVDNIFGLFEEGTQNNLKEPVYDESFELAKIFTLSTDKIKTFIKGLSELVHEHREHEYEIEWYNGYKQTYLVGERLECGKNYNNEAGNIKTLEKYPLKEVWNKYLIDSKIEPIELLQILFYLYVDCVYNYYFDKLDKWQRSQYKPLEGWRKSFLDSIYPIDKIKDVKEFEGNISYVDQVSTITRAYFDDGDKKEMFDVLNKILNNFLHLFPENKAEEEKTILEITINPWLHLLSVLVYNDDSFKEYFYLKYKLYTMTKFVDYNPTFEEFMRAFELKIIDKNEMFKEFFLREERTNNISRLTNNKDNISNKYPFIKEIRNKTVEKILEIELKRGDLPTPVTRIAMYILYYEGMEYFVDILLRLDKETFVRGYIYAYYNEKINKKESFSQLLRVCYPKAGEDEKLLKKLLKGKKISDKRLLEAAMYAPQWLDIVAKYLKWEGLRSAAWYFHAHINETFSAEKETIVAHYSPITPEAFNDGAFDIDWFKEAYEKVGEERFKILYDCAKYISGGSNHRRAQMFADATLGKLNMEELKESAEVKRNRDSLLCITLIPMSKGDVKDVLNRYEFLQKFLKQSKKFGAQRRDSETKTVNIALGNLARNAGYSDVIRLTWDMEAEKIKEIVVYLEPKVIDDISVKLVIDEDGQTDIEVSKNDKILKSIPAKYNKNEYVSTLKEVKNELKDQYKRAKAELERSMEAENVFTLNEINNLNQNLVIAPLIRTLVLKTGKHLGYFKDGKLDGVNGDSYTLKAKDKIIIAHPIHLYESGKWSEYQKDLFERQIKQPFKQVFRELYIPNEDELANGTVSRRYAGHQVQPKKTVALLKTRMWTVSYEEGLQKVYYKENIIAKIYALADWFSPSDVESPTLETVEFFDRHTYKSIAIKDIPKIIFSEIMRDVDLVVSVAHVGGVDPEASLSTIDMRKAIIAESLRLMKIQNVRLEGNYAHIAGTLGEYSVHLGSAMVYKQAKGSLYIIPVHSQHRGKIFLPFMDEDPKTAEILSKVLMLSEDTKIKDPHILEQIKNV